MRVFTRIIVAVFFVFFATSFAGMGTVFSSHAEQKQQRVMKNAAAIQSSKQAIDASNEIVYTAQRGDGWIIATKRLGIPEEYWPEVKRLNPGAASRINPNILLVGKKVAVPKSLLERPNRGKVKSRKHAIESKPHLEKGGVTEKIQSSPQIKKSSQVDIVAEVKSTVSADVNIQRKNPYGDFGDKNYQIITESNMEKMSSDDPRMEDVAILNGGESIRLRYIGKEESSTVQNNFSTAKLSQVEALPSTVERKKIKMQQHHALKKTVTPKVSMVKDLSCCGCHVVSMGFGSKPLVTKRPPMNSHVVHENTFQRSWNVLCSYWKVFWSLMFDLPIMAIWRVIAYSISFIATFAILVIMAFETWGPPEAVKAFNKWSSNLADKLVEKFKLLELLDKKLF